MLIKTPSNEHRPYQAFFSTFSKNKIYIDHTNWEIIGKHEKHEKYIVPKEPVYGRFIDIYPLTIGWIGDLHVADETSEKLTRIFETFRKINPSLSIILGDIVNGCGTYNNITIKEEWFEKAWNNMKQKLPNVFWVKGNHDVEPSRHYYYNWFTRLWHLKLRKFDLIGFDTYNEDRVLEGTVFAHVGLSDIFYLKRIFLSTENTKIIFSHHPLNEWYSCSHSVLKDFKETTLNIAAHSHSLEKKLVNDVETYINGTAGPNYEGCIISILILYPDKKLKFINVKGDIEVEKNENTVVIKTGETVNWENENIKDKIPVRLNIHNVNLIALVPSETETCIKYSLDGNQLFLEKDIEIYIKGKIDVDEVKPIDICPLLDGSEIRSYHIPEEISKIKANLH